MVGTRQDDRGIGGEKVWDAPLLGDRAGGVLQRGARYDDVEARGCFSQDCELAGDRVRHQLTNGLGRGLARGGRLCGSHVTHHGSDGHEVHPVAFDQVAEVRRRA